MRKRGLLEEKTDEGLLRLSFDDINVARSLFGPREENIKYLKKYFNIKASIRGNHLTLIGGKKDVEDTGKVINELHGIVKKGFPVNVSDIDHAVRFVVDDPSGGFRHREGPDIHSRFEEAHYAQEQKPKTIRACHEKI